MFNSVNEEYNKKVADEHNAQFIVESVVGSEALPMSDEEDENLVDVDSVDPKMISEVDKVFDKIVEKDVDNKLDTTIDDMIDDDDDGDIEIIVDSSDDILD